MASNYNHTSAVAYERFSVSQQETAPEIRALPEKKSHHRAVPYGKYFVVMTCVFTVLLAVVFSYMQLAQLTNQNDKLRTQIADLQSEENALSAKKEQIYNLAYVEDYAKNVLGMVKLDKSQIVYVDLRQDDQMIVAKASESRGAQFWKDIVRSFSAVLEYLN
ncbi:MAG: cell division protein FtsL [Clostridiaceae bacterium]|nr:cell division protein FtsL [Clostridiaceae bacterium]